MITAPALWPAVSGCGETHSQGAFSHEEKCARAGVKKGAPHR
jgi:hypothetical protein